jgi:protein-L-isoaspartate(D-aspartate) O-methyltransferase
VDICNLILTQTRTVAFSKMMDDQGLVIGVEHISELYTKGKENISKSHLNLINEGKIILKESDGRLGYEEFAPYDAIHVGAATEKVPKALLDQLKPGGRLMIPVGELFQYIYLIDKDMNGNIKKEPMLSVRYVPLTDKEKQLAHPDTNIFGI